MAFYKIGRGAAIKQALFTLNRSRLVKELQNEVGAKNSVVLLKGGVDFEFYATDINSSEFRQEPMFHWCFGVTEPDCMGAIEVDSGKSHLFFPKLPKEYAIWMGHIKELIEFQQRYEVLIVVR